MNYTRMVPATALLIAFFLLAAFTNRVDELETSLAQKEEALEGKQMQVYYLEMLMTEQADALQAKEKLIVRTESGRKYYVKELNEQEQKIIKRNQELERAEKEVARLETAVAQKEVAPKPERAVKAKAIPKAPKATAPKPKTEQPAPKATGGIAMEATAYTAFCDTGCIGVTATGVDVSKTIFYEGKRIVAVDPDVIPLHSLVRVQFKNGTSFNAIALDTGGAIQGNRVDVLVASHAEAVSFGRQEISVTILQ